MRQFLKISATIAALAGAALIQVPAGARPEPILLWQFAQDCLWAQQSGQKPDCEAVGRDAQGAYAYVIKKDITGNLQFLLLPTARITGIESAELEKDGAPNYFAYAWDATRFVKQRRGADIPRAELALAVNSAAGRSMHQLHIHIDCVRGDVRKALEAHSGEVTTKWLSIADAKWPEMATAFNNHHYQVRWVDGPSLQGINLFRLVADRDADSGGDMALQTIVVVGSPEKSSGFYVLTDRAHIRWGEQDPVLDDPASGEELMDHNACA